jgi:hypothetical protein
MNYTRNLEDELTTKELKKSSTRKKKFAKSELAKPKPKG